MHTAELKGKQLECAVLFLLARSSPIEPELVYTNTVPVPSIARSSGNPTRDQLECSMAWKASQNRLNGLLFWVVLLERGGNGSGALSIFFGSTIVLAAVFKNLNRHASIASVVIIIEFIRTLSKGSKLDHEILFNTTKGIQFKRLHVNKGFPQHLSISFLLLSIYGSVEIVLSNHHVSTMPRFLIRVLILGSLSVVKLAEILEPMKNKTFMQLIPFVFLTAYSSALIFFSKHALRDIVPIVTFLYFAWASIFCVQNHYFWPWLCRSLQKIIPVHLLWPHTLSIKCWLIFFPLRRQLGFLPLWVRKASSFLFTPKQMICFTVLAFLVCIEEYLLGVAGSIIILGTLLVGNVHIPFALARIALAITELRNLHYDADPVLYGFYGLVLLQGILYVFAGLLEGLVSPLMRMDLARQSHLNYLEGHKCVDLCYQNTYSKIREDGLFEEKEDLLTYALEILQSYSLPTQEKMLCAVRILKSVMEIQASNHDLVSKINSSHNILRNLLRLVSLKGPQDQKLKYFSAKIIAMASQDLQFIGINDAVPTIASMLFEEDQGMSAPQHVIVNVGVESDGNEIWNFIRDIIDPPLERWGTADEDSLPVLAMQILVQVDYQSNQVLSEISRGDIIDKLINFSVSSREIFAISALKLLSKLAMMKGVRDVLAEHPLLLSNINRIIQGQNQVKNLTVTILKHMVFVEGIREELCSYRIILRSLVILFCEGDKEAGKVLVNISQDAANCCALWEEDGYILFCKLMKDLEDDSNVHAAANLAQNMLEYLPSNCNAIIEILPNNLHMVLQKIMIGQEDIHSLIGLTAKMCAIIPHSFVKTKPPAAFFKKIVNGLQNHPTKEYPRIRRSFIEMALAAMKADNQYATILENHGILQSLEVVTNSKSNMENFKVFTCEGAVMENGPSMSQLLQETKELIKTHSHPAGSQGDWTDGETEIVEE